MIYWTGDRLPPVIRAPVTLGLALTAFSLGLRHGIDWDHIAAIADLSSTAESRRRGFLLSFLYAVGHGAVVVALGVVAILFGAALPEGVDIWMGRIVGVTLVALGLWVLIELVRKGRDFRLRSRWILVFRGASAGVRRLREAARDGAAVAFGHRRRFGHSHETASAGSAVGAGNGTAAGIGLLHGIGFESPTQIAVFVASTSVVGVWAGVGLLVAWVVGLVGANSILAVLAAYGLLGAERNFIIYAAVAVLVGGASLAMGLLLLVGLEVLPAVA